MIAAILRAQWLSLRLFRLGQSRRATALSALAALVWYGLWTAVAVAIAKALAVESAAGLATALPGGLLLVTLYWQMAPVVSATLGASVNLRKLLAFPVRHEKLFAVELLLRLAGGAEMLLVLLGGIIGLLRNPAFSGLAATPRMTIPVLLLVATNTALAAGTRNLLERLLSHKHVREVVVLLMVICIAAPRVLMTGVLSAEQIAALSSVLQQAFWPWTAAAWLVLDRQPFTAAVWLLAWTVGAYLFGRWQFERSLRFDVDRALARPAAHDRDRRESIVEALYRLPSYLLPDPLGAAVEKEIRSLVRTPRFRMVFMMGFSFGLLVWLPLVVGRGRMPNSAAGENFLVLVSLYALTLLGQVSYWNAFGFDRSAARAYFLFPKPLSIVLIGKNIAAAILICLEIAMVTLVSWLVRIPIPGSKVIESFSVTLVGALYIIALGNLSSVHFRDR